MKTYLRSLCSRRAFTLIELLTVMMIIAVLAGLILSISGYVNKKSAMAVTQGEITALRTACENYKADNGFYPHQPVAVGGTVPTGGTIPSDSANVDPRTQGNPANYKDASLELYQALTSDYTCDGTPPAAGTRNYLPDLKPSLLGRADPSTAVSSTNKITYLADAFSNPIGYCTAYSTIVASGTLAANTAPSVGYNPTYDVWSTAAQTANPFSPATSGSAGDPMLQWIKNW